MNSVERRRAILTRTPHGPNPSTSLLKRATQKDQEALRELLEPYQAPIYRLAYRMTGHPEDAEDLAQEALLRVLLRLSSFRGECSFRTWVYRIALNACLTSRRKSHPPVEALEEGLIGDAVPGPDQLLLRRDLQRRIAREIARLPKTYREVVLLRIADELTYAEIAEVLGLPFNTARMRIYRGMERLRRQLSAMPEGEQ